MKSVLNRFNLILLMILMFSGQVVAAPFLECAMPNMVMSEAEGEIPCEDMKNMTNDSMKSEMNMDMTDFSANNCNCDLLCGYCLSLNSIILSHSNYVISFILPLVDFDHSSIYPFASLENPFRPPIFS